MIDIHIIDSGHENYKAQLARLVHPLVTIQAAPYVPGNVLEARWKAFNMGTAPYVSWVDDDDEILSLDWLPEAVALLDKNPEVSAVYPRWQMSENGLVRHTTSGEPFSAQRLLQAPGLIDCHHLTIMRRENVLATLEAIRTAQPVMVKSTERMLTIGQLRYGRLLAHSALAYDWKLRDGSARTLPEHPSIDAFTKMHIRESLRHAQ